MSGSSWGFPSTFPWEVEARCSLDGICMGGSLGRSRVVLDARVVVDMEEIVERPARLTLRFDVVTELGPDLLMFVFEPVIDWAMFGRPVEESGASSIIDYVERTIMVLTIWMQGLTLGGRCIRCTRGSSGIDVEVLRR